MELYEQNYLRVRCLVPDLKNLEGVHVSYASECLTLRLEVLEKTKHTTTVHLSYLMSGNDTRPDVEVRVYHDALQAEILKASCKVRSGYLPDGQKLSSQDSALLCKWKVNRFLYKWLNYLQGQGHGFSAMKSTA